MSWKQVLWKNRNKLRQLLSRSDYLVLDYLEDNSRTIPADIVTFSSSENRIDKFAVNQRSQLLFLKLFYGAQIYDENTDTYSVNASGHYAFPDEPEIELYP